MIPSKLRINNNLDLYIIVEGILNELKMNKNIFVHTRYVFLQLNQNRFKISILLPIYFKLLLRLLEEKRI